MRALSTTSAMLLTFLLWHAPARAQESAPPPPPADEGPTHERTAVFGVESIGGFAHLGVVDIHNSSGRETPGLDYGGTFVLSPLTRVGAHWFLGPLTIGTGLHVSRGTFGIGGTVTPISATYLGASPRVGVALPLNRVVTLWFRAGISALHVVQNDQDLTLISPGGEALLLLQLVKGFGLSLGPSGEYGIAGWSGSRQYRLRTYSFGFGLYADL